MTLRRSHARKNFIRKAGGVFREVISKLILGVILHRLRELYWGKKHPPFLRGAGGIKEAPDNTPKSPFRKGGLIRSRSQNTMKIHVMLNGAPRSEESRQP